MNKFDKKYNSYKNIFFIDERLVIDGFAISGILHCYGHFII